MSGLSIEVYKIDLVDIVNNAVNKEYWGKTWNLFEYDGYLTTLSLYEINTESSTLWFKIRLMEEGSLADYYVTSIKMDSYNKVIFRKSVLRGLQSNLNSVMDRDTRKTQGYADLKEEERLELQEARDEAKALLDEDGVTNEAIREAYLSSIDIDSGLYDYVVNNRGKLDYIYNVAKEVIEVE